MNSWYLVVEGKQFGPIDDQELRRRILVGTLSANDLIWRPGFERWLRCIDVPGLILPPPLPADPNVQNPSSSGARLNPEAQPSTPVLAPPVHQSIEPRVPTAWLSFYIWVRLPFGGFLGFINTFAMNLRGEVADGFVSLAFFLWVSLVVVAIGLHRRKLWGWRANWYLLGIESVFFALEPFPGQDAVAPGWAIFKLSMIGVLWVLPNYFYFSKRRQLFS